MSIGYIPASLTSPDIYALAEAARESYARGCRQRIARTRWTGACNRSPRCVVANAGALEAKKKVDAD